MAKSPKKTTESEPAAEGAGEAKSTARPRKRAAKRTAKRSTKRAGTKKVDTKKSNTKKTGTKKATTKKTDAKKSGTKNTAPATGHVGIPAESAALAARLDRAELGEKVRVHALAKLIGLPSRDVVAALAELGLKKVAQSSLTRAEADRFLDAVAPRTTDADTAETTEAAETTDAAEPAESADTADAAEAEENLRVQVENNVANEIHQIEQKVDSELEERAAEQDGAPLFMAPGQDPARDASTNDAAAEPTAESSGDSEAGSGTADAAEDADASEDSDSDSGSGSGRRSRRRSSRRRGRRGTGRGRGSRAASESDDEENPEPAEHEAEPESAVEHALDESRGELPDKPVALKGSTRLEAKRRRRSERREEARRRRHVLTEEEFLARRESVKREMVVRERERSDHPGTVVQVGVLEDGMLVEHFVASETQSTIIGNLYLGRVQNVLPSMEAAFIDIGQGRNGVLYAGEVDWRAAGLGGRSRRIEQALHSGDQILVQVTKDPVGHKGARLTTQISLAGRFLVYVPGGRSAGISRKLPAPERKRLKAILKHVMPEHGGAIIRTAAENVPEEAIAADVRRLHRQWEDIQARADKEKKSRGSRPVTLYEEPDMLVKVVRDLFNEDFTRLIVDGERSWNTVSNYVHSVAPDLEDRLEKFVRREHGQRDAFEVHRVDEQLQKALGRVVFLPSGGSLVIDRTEAMTVIDVNTGRFTGSGGNLEETVTRNNLEAAEEIVRQLRLRDLGGMIVIDFIDMVLPENRDLVLRRLTEALGRDRTRHQVSEVTSLGLVQLTRKRLGTGLLETFSTCCECCDGRGIVLHEDPVEQDEKARRHEERDRRRKREEKEKEQETDDAASVSRRGPARRRRRRGRDHDAELEKLAASVVVSDAADDEGAETSAAGNDDRDDRDDRGAGRSGDEDRRGGRGRRRRRGSRGRRRDRREDRQADAGADSGVDEISRVVDDALDRAEAEDPDEPSGRDYETALAEFESSPRRKRATRGNSRSDHRPRREDFAAADDREAEHAESDDAETGVSRAGTRSSRRRRRAVRRTTRTSKNGGGQGGVGKRGAGRTRSAETPTDRAGRSDGSARQRSARRGRRRATRRRG